MSYEMNEVLPDGNVHFPHGLSSPEDESSREDFGVTLNSLEYQAYSVATWIILVE